MVFLFYKNIYLYMKALIKQIFRKLINESRYTDFALDSLEKAGGFDKLPEIDKLVLLGPSGDIPKLQALDLIKIFKSNGGTFGKLQTKVRIKKIDNQPIDHKFSKEFAGKDGFLFPYISYTENNEPYVSVRFKEFYSDLGSFGGGSYEERPIMLKNMFPIDYNDVDDEFAKYQLKSDQEREEFRRYLNSPLEGDDDSSDF